MGYPPVIRNPFARTQPGPTDYIDLGFKNNKDLWTAVQTQEGLKRFNGYWQKPNGNGGYTPVTMDDFYNYSKKYSNASPTHTGQGQGQDQNQNQNQNNFGGTPSYAQQRADAEADRIRIRNENALGQLEVQERQKEQAKDLIKNLLGNITNEKTALNAKLAGHKQEYTADKNLANNTLKAAESMYQGNTLENKKDWRASENQAKTNTGTGFNQAQDMLHQFGAGNSASSQIAQGAIDTFNKQQGENNLKFGTQQRQYDLDYNTAKQQRGIDLQKAYDKYKVANLNEQADYYNNVNEIYNKAQTAEMEYGTNMSPKKDKAGNPVIDKYGVVQMNTTPSHILGRLQQFSKNNIPKYDFKRKYQGAVPNVKPKTASYYARGENVGISKDSTQSKY